MKVTVTELKAFINKHQSIASKTKIKNCQVLILQLTTEDYITKSMLKPEYNIFSKIKSTISALSLSSSQKSRLNQIEKRF